MKVKKKTAAFVFSGGGIKGLSQLGALQVLEDFVEKHNIKVKTVVGTSVGSVSASLFALGIPVKKVIDYLKEDSFTFAKLDDVKIKGLGLFKAKQLHKAFSHFFASRTFASAKCDLFINAVDLYSGKECVFSKKGVYERHTNIVLKKRACFVDAVSSSIAIPLLFEPVKIGDALLVDGGLLNALPLNYIDPAKYDVVFVVQTMGSLDYLDNEKPKRNQVLVQSFSIIENEYMLPKIYETIKSHSNIVHIRLHNQPSKRTNKKVIMDAIRFGEEKTKEKLTSFFGDV